MAKITKLSTKSLGISNLLDDDGWRMMGITDDRRYYDYSKYSADTTHIYGERVTVVHDDDEAPVGWYYVIELTRTENKSYPSPAAWGKNRYIFPLPFTMELLNEVRRRAYRCLN